MAEKQIKPNVTEKDFKLLEKMCKDIEENSLCGCKKYWNDRDSLSTEQRNTKFISNIFGKGLAALSSGAAILPFLEKNPRMKLTVVGLMGIGATIVGVWSDTVKYEQQVSQTHQIASEYDSLQKRTRLYRLTKLPNTGVTNYEAAQQTIEQLNEESTQINNRAPPLYDPNSWLKVKKELYEDKGLENYFTSDGEEKDKCIKMHSSKP